MTLLRVLVIGRQYVVRIGLANILETRDGFAAVDEASSLASALPVLRTTTYDLVILDLAVCAIETTNAIAALQATRRGLRILIFSDRSGDGDVLRALNAGASGYLHPSATKDEIVDAVQQVLKRGRYLPSLIAQSLAEGIGSEALTQRELEVLALVREGWRNRQIAKELAVAETTINFHVRNALSKLTANDRTHAVTIAIRRGLLPLLNTQKATTYTRTVNHSK
jgi:DNA-binding NarL/FixJ family response regulator